MDSGSNVRFGVLTPVVYRPPGQANEWEGSGTVDDLVRIVSMAETLGYHHVTCSEHVGVPDVSDPHRGATYWEPVSTLSFLAGATEGIKIATHVIVLGYHHPLALTKTCATMDRLSGGRLILGVGVGSLAKEFELLGADFRFRGRRADEAIAALRSSWRQRRPEFQGEFFSFSDFVMDPLGVQERLPIWVGGSTSASLRRAVMLGDGWVPFGRAPEELEALLTRHKLPANFDVVLECTRLDPLRSPEAVRQRVERLIGVGATVINVGFVHKSAEECVDQLGAMRAIFPDAEWGALVNPPKPETGPQ